MKIAFQNISIKPTYETETQKSLRERIEAEFSEQAIKASDELKAKLIANLDRAQPGYCGLCVDIDMKNARRYAYIKGFDKDGMADPSKRILIDLLLHTFQEMG